MKKKTKPRGKLEKPPGSELDAIRHSLAHLLAAAVMELYPDAKRTIGPAIDNGFYFDFDFSKPISDSDLPAIEKKMREILPTWDRFTKHLLTRDEAKKEYPKNPYKHELIDEFSEEGKKKVSFYKSGTYWDLCRGGHVESMRAVKPDSFKLERVAGAYWRADEKNKQLTRIYAIAFKTKEDLNVYVKMREEAERRDHKKLGVQLDLFTFSDLVGPGLPLWTPKGTVLRNIADTFVWELRKKHGYEQVDIPHITKKDLYEKSGHWDKFKDDLFRITTREGHEFAMKPMNCPHHVEIYKRKPWSYRELPQRYASTTKVYRDEQTGELSGLARVRAITQDDAHVFCRQSQAKEELLKIWDIVHEFYGAIGFKLRVRLSLHDPKHPEKFLGDKKQWSMAEDALRQIAKEKKADAFEAPGEAAFYGPKLDFMAKDSLGREWQVATIQLDMNMPERFELTCTNEKGKPERIVMLHAAIMGAIERYLAIIIEHFAGAFPLWMAPVQAAVIPVGEKFEAYGKKIAEKLKAGGIRVETAQTNETLGKRIREAEKQKIPYILVVGDREQQAETVSVRHFRRGQEGEIGTDVLVEKMLKEINDKVI
jgi:threonyl-tRNA synthetase